MKHVFLLFFLWCGMMVSGLAQLKGTVLNQETGQPVAYANIWVKNETLGTTSSEKGEFSLPQPQLQGKTLVVSCLGYEKTSVQISGGTIRITLKPQTVTLGEVTVKKSARLLKTVINPLDQNTQYSFGSNGTPWIVAQYIPYKPAYAATPFLQEVALVTLSNLRNATFRLHLLQVNENGTPGQDLLPVPLLGKATKGIKTVRLDLSPFDLPMPPEGVFIAFEWLILPQNRYDYEDPETGQKAVPPRVSYEPSLRTYSPNTLSPHGWIYHQGQWVSTNQREGDAITSATPHFQLTLSN